MEKICTDWNIPFLNLSSVSRADQIPEMLKQTSPKVILSSVEDISREEIQSELQLLDIAYVAIDESQVLTQYIVLSHTMFPKVLKTNRFMDNSKVRCSPQIL